jgi:hypothetical protein
MPGEDFGIRFLQSAISDSQSRRFGPTPFSKTASRNDLEVKDLLKGVN